MKKISLLVVCLFSLFQVRAQVIMGNIIDENQEAIPYATLMLMDAKDSTLVKADYSKEDGTFKIDRIPNGQYHLNITTVGYANYKSKIINLSTSDEFVVMENIQLQKATENLEEVVVTAQRPLIEVLPDKTVFNVENSINATGNNALELLRKSPGVVVDGSDNIFLQGRTGLQIYIDGKPSPLSGQDLITLLRTMQSSEISAIEIITNPSAKYDAEGNAGIINIKLKKDKRLGANANVNTGFAYGKRPKFNASTSTNYRNKNVNLFGNYGFNKSENESFINLFRTQEGISYAQNSTNINNQTGHNFKAGADWFISDEHTLGFMTNGQINDRTGSNFSRTSIQPLDATNVTEVLQASNDSEGNTSNLNFNINYRFADTLGTSLNIDADYGRYRNRFSTNQPNVYLNGTEDQILFERLFQTDAPTDIDIYTIKSDYERNLWGGKLGLGVKFSLVATDNTFEFVDVEGGVPMLNIDRSNQFIFEENINAAYFSYKKQVGKWNFQLGLRAEQTNSTGQLTAAKPNQVNEVDRHYLDFFPSGGITFSPKRMHQFSLTYSRRIDRPKYQDLNPFEYKLDELSFRLGNPFLRPQYTHNVQLSHTFKYSLNTSLSYSRTTDYFAQLSDTLSDGRTFIQQRNLANRETVNLSIGTPIPVTKWWNMYANASLFHTRYQATFEEGKFIDLAATSYSIYAQSTFSLPKDFKLEISGFYSGPGIWAGTYESTAIYSLNAGIQKKVLNGRGNLRLSVNDIFLGMNWSGISQFGDLYIEADGGWESRQIKLNFSYQIGNDQVKGVRKRKTGLEDEKSRIDL